MIVNSPKIHTQNSKYSKTSHTFYIICDNVVMTIKGVKQIIVGDSTQVTSDEVNQLYFT